MKLSKDSKFRIFSTFVSAFLFTAPPCLADSAYSEINLSYPRETKPIQVVINRPQSKAYGWQPGQMVTVSAYVERSNGQKAVLRSSNGEEFCKVRLDRNAEATLLVVPDAHSFSGRLVVTGNGKTLHRASPHLADVLGRTLEKIYEYRFPDGARIRVHYTDQIFEETATPSTFARDVLDAAVSAYQTITEFKEFKSEGFSFVHPDRSYAYDPDRTIDVFLGNPADENPFQTHGFGNLTFKDAPCFDTVKTGAAAYEAVILLPSNYGDFIKNWEKMNPSTLGTRNVEVDLRGTLIHEMLHAILFYYNKNLNRGRGQEGPRTKREIDWYVEGLARYFETFAGARHDFFSQGFKETLPDKIRFSRGGANFFMRYPDQPFKQLRYENALFWRHVDYHFGMHIIEKLSRAFRGEDKKNFAAAFHRATGISFEATLKEFAAAALLKDFGLKDDEVYLKDIARSQLVYQNAALFLVDGLGDAERLGERCRTDWIGRWDNERVSLGEKSVAGDNTEEADLSGWASDYFEIRLDPEQPEWGWFGAEFTEGEDSTRLGLQIIVRSKGGSILRAPAQEIPLREKTGVSLRALCEKEGLDASDVDAVYLVVTNLDPDSSARYEIVSKPA